MIDGNLSRIIGRTAFSSGERLFPYTREEMNEVSWMRINCVGDVAEFRRKSNGVWWCEKPWNDRMDPLRGGGHSPVHVLHQHRGRIAPAQD